MIINEGQFPVSVSIIKKSLVYNDKIGYLGIYYKEITLCGLFVSYYELNTKSICGIWDSTGYIDIDFINKTEDSISVLFNYNRPIPVRLYGIVRLVMGVESKEIKVEGIKIFKVDMKELVYHKSILIYDWVYHLKEKSLLTNSNLQFHIVNTDKTDKTDKGKTDKTVKSVSYTQINKREDLIEVIRFISNEKGNCRMEDLIEKTCLKKEELNKIIKDLVDDVTLFIDEGNYYLI